MAITGKQKVEVEEQEEVEQVAGPYRPRVWNMVRWINKANRTNVDQGQWSVEDVNNYLDQLYELGYVLFNTHYLGEGDGAYGIMYVLTWNG